MFIAPIVEGHGEVEAVRRMLARIAATADPNVSLRVNIPIRIKSGSFLNDPSYFSKYVSLAAAKARQEIEGQVFVLLDCEDECPAHLGPALLGRARDVVADIPITILLAHREYETWFIAAVESLRGIGGMSDDVQRPANPEATRDAKGWLGRHMPHGYDPISHQLTFTNAFDIASARSVPSFDRLCRKMVGLAG